MEPSLENRATDPAWKRWFVLAILLNVGILTIQYSHKINDDRRSAFLRWRPQILQLDAVDIYARYAYPNPPIMAILLSPLAHLPASTGALAWFYLKVGMAMAAVYWVFLLVQSPGRPFPSWAKALVVLLSMRPIMGDLSHGNVNVFILFLIVASLYAFSQRRDLSAGVFLALAIACKVTPALFVPYFLWKRAWKTFAGCMAGLVLFLWIVPMSFLGAEKNAQRLSSWFQLMIKPYVIGGVITPEHENQSLPGLLVRLTTHSPSFSTFVGGQYTPLEYHNFIALDSRWPRFCIKVCMVLFAGLFMLFCRTPTAQRHDWRLAAEYSLVVLGMLLFSERTWKHHCVTLLLPFAVICYHLAVCRPGWRLRVYLLGTLTAVVVLMASTSTGLSRPWDHFAKLAQVYGAYVWAYLALVAALIVLLRGGVNTANPLSAPDAPMGPGSQDLRFTR